MQGKKIFLYAAAMTVLLLSGCANAKQESQLSYVGSDTAKNAALQSAGVTKEEASNLSSDVKTRDGQDYYEVTFTYGNQTYTYDVDAFTGLVIGGDTAPAANNDISPAVPAELPNAENVGGNAAEIGEEKAKSIALDHAGVKEKNVTMLPVKKDYEDGKLVYEIEFYSPDGQKEYDYEIDVYSGEIVSYDYDAEGYAPSAASGTTSNTSAISEARAKEIALAQVPGAKTSDIYKFKTDYDDGRMKYEGEIIYNNMEYEFEIDAYSGKIIDWDSERYDYHD